LPFSCLPKLAPTNQTTHPPLKSKQKGLGSIALVLATLLPDIGNTWYGLTALSPLAAVYYFQKGERAEEVRVKMVTSDDDATTDIVVEGDQEEIARMARELGLVEKGMVYVKGLLEQ
jgi:hypothetical protein